MLMNHKWGLAVALLGVALISHPVVAAEVKQFQDDRGTLHITNPGVTDPGKPGTGPQPGMRPERNSPQAPPAANLPPQTQDASPPETFTAPPPPEADPTPAAEEAESPEPGIIPPPEVTASPEWSQKEAPAAVEPRPATRFSPGGVDRGRGMRGRH